MTPRASDLSSIMASSSGHSPVPHSVIDARFAAELLLLGIAHRQRSLASDPAAHRRRSKNLSAGPPCRIAAGQVAGRLERTGLSSPTWFGAISSRSRLTGPRAKLPLFRVWGCG